MKPYKNIKRGGKTYSEHGTNEGKALMRAIWGAALFWSGLAALAWDPLPQLAGAFAVLVLGLWLAVAVEKGCRLADWRDERRRRRFSADEEALLDGHLNRETLLNWPWDGDAR